jgi:hypothetical protein
MMAWSGVSYGVSHGEKGWWRKKRDNTTGCSRFAECQKHSVNLQSLSAKSLPRGALGKDLSANFLSAKEALPRALSRALGKLFAESKRGPRQRKGYYL